MHGTADREREQSNQTKELVLARETLRNSGDEKK
jgi:hypothetical protein